MEKPEFRRADGAKINEIIPHELYIMIKFRVKPSEIQYFTGKEVSKLLTLANSLSINPIDN